MPGPHALHTSDIFSISGSEISEVYVRNRMLVHFQGMSKTLQFPPTIALQGAPTCSIGISPYGLYNRLNDAGRLVLLNQHAVQFGSAPVVRVDGRCVMLTTKDPGASEGPDDVPALKNYYHPPIPEKHAAIALATPSAELAYTVGKLRVTRRLISPFLCGNAQALMPAGIEEFALTNTSGNARQVTLLIPRPSLVNLQEKELKPTDQDTVYVCSAPVKAQVHEAFSRAGARGVVMGSTECGDRMVLAVPDMEGVTVDVQPYFCLNRLKQDLLLNDDGSFYEKRKPIPKQDYGAALSLTFTVKPKTTVTIPVAIALDFPQQRYIDGKTFARKYVGSFPQSETRAMDMATLALKSYPDWLNRTLTVQGRILGLIRNSPAYRNDQAGARRLARLIFNEFSFPLSNAAVWIEDPDGNESARFLECFDYAYIDPSDVDWYSMVLLVLFPRVERELCQRFVDSILAEDSTPRYYHHHASFVEARKHFEEHPEHYEGMSLTQIRDAFKVRGSVAHDLGALPKGHALRNVSDYAWYNNNYWVDLFPKLALRVLRNVKFLGDVDFLKKNWETLKFGFDHVKKLDIDGDGVPEGNPNEVKNTFDNITLFGVDAYDATMFMAGCQAMIRMAELMNDEPARARFAGDFAQASASFEKLWRDRKTRSGRRLQYYITCYDPVTGKTNTDVWTNQLDALWSLIAMGEEPFIADERVRKILRTIYRNNRTRMGWAMARTEDGGPVASDQGKDVYTTSNYVFAQLLDYYGLVRESKQVYAAMDRVVFRHANSLITPDNLRADFEREEGESARGPHYIVAAYPRPGAVLTQIVMQFVKERQDETGSRRIAPQELQSFIAELMK